MRLRGVSTQRTYRYVRLAIVGAVVTLGVSLTEVWVSGGAVTSISALFYTPGRTAFTGVLLAIPLALLALSGHSVEQVLLNIAAVFAVLIAVIPTPIGPGDVAGRSPVCPGPAPCVPTPYADDVWNGLLTFAVMTVLGAACALAVTRAERALTTGVTVAAGVAVLTVVVVLVWWGIAPEAVLRAGHLVATAGFFGIMAAVAVVNAVTAARGWRALYVGVAIGTLAFLLYLLAVGIARLAGANLAGQPWVLVGEIGLVASFAVFWVAQTVQFWDEVDPRVIAR